MDPLSLAAAISVVVILATLVWAVLHPGLQPDNDPTATVDGAEPHDGGLILDDERRMRQ